MIGSFALRLARCSLLSASVAAIAVASAPAAAQAQTRQFDIPAQPLSSAILEFSRQSDVMVLLAPELAEGQRSRTVRGAMAPNEAIGRLLGGTGLRAISNQSGGYRIARVDEASPVSGEEQAGGAAADDGSADEGAVAEILVVGSRSLNADIPRSEDDAQPYVIFSQDEIRRSNATNIDDFLRTRLPQNAQRQGVNQFETVNGGTDVVNSGRIDLRGLGTNQTLILVDGRRLPGASYYNVQQANISGIPLSAIERIEVLPSTAGAIYGGGAVGGVLNIILRRDYTGLEARLDYGNTFDGATGDFKASLLGGLGFGGTRVMFRASRERTADLLLSDRSDLLSGARTLLLANNPAAISAVVAGGDTGNFCASTATGLGSCNGAQLIFDNGTPFGASIGSIPDGYAGPAGDAGAALRATSGRYRFEAPPGSQALIQGTHAEALGANVTQRVTDWLQVFGDISWDRVRGEFRTFADFFVLLQPTAANNPFQQPVRLRVPLPSIFGRGSTEVETLRLNGGVIARLPGGWSTSLEQGWSRGRTSLTARVPLSNNAVAALLAPYAFADVGSFPPPDISAALGQQVTISGPVETTTINSALRFAGPLFSLPGGRATATLLAERREEKIDRFILAILPTYLVNPSRRQEARSLYLETRFPLVAAANGVPFIRELELQGSIRYDRFQTVGTSNQFIVADPAAPVPDATYFTNRFESVDFLAGARWQPVEGLILRASYSTGFLPPAVTNLSPQVRPPQSVTTVAAISDPRRNGEDLIGDLNGNVVITSAGNPLLEPESSRSFSFGFVVEPTWLRGFRLSADYTDIRKSGEISSISLQQLIDNEDRFPGRITRGPNRPGDPAGFAGPIVAYDISPLNIAGTRVRAWDFQIDYDLETRFGRFHPYAVVTRQTAFARALLPDSPFISRLDYSDGPLRWRGNAGLTWAHDGLSLSWNMQFYDSYRICLSADLPATCSTKQLNQGGARIPSQSYHDIAARYEFGESSPLLRGTEISLGIQNLFNAQPPLIATTSLSGFYSSYGDARLRRFTISLRRRFGR